MAMQALHISHRYQNCSEISLGNAFNPIKVYRLFYEPPGSAIQCIYVFMWISQQNNRYLPIPH